MWHNDYKCVFQVISGSSDIHECHIFKIWEFKSSFYFWYCSISEHNNKKGKERKKLIKCNVSCERLKNK